MDGKEAAKMKINKFAGAYLKKIKLIATLVAGGLVLFMVLMSMLGGGGDASNVEAASSDGNSNTYYGADADSSLVQYLLNFGGKGETYDIDGRKFYKSYDDTSGKLTVGLDVYIDGHKAGFSVSGYVSDTESGPAKQVDNVYDYVMDKFNNEKRCVYIEQELSDSCASTIRNSKWDLVNSLESSLGTTLSMQQKYALCAIYYRRS